jgi:hypothetical protein
MLEPSKFNASYERAQYVGLVVDAYFEASKTVYGNVSVFIE